MNHLGMGEPAGTGQVHVGPFCGGTQLGLVTVDGRVTAGRIMGIGLLTLTVVTAQVASSLVAQGTSRDQRSQQTQRARPR